jgi:hypothetical protein
MTDLITKIEEYSLSDSDIRRVLGRNCKIIEYHELSGVRSLEELLPKPIDYIVILIEEQKDSGHWTALARQHDLFLYFDPYGYVPDHDLKWIPMKARKLLGQSERYLTELINKTDKEVRFNNIDYQSHNSSISTCGSHVSCYLWHFMHKGMNLQDYYKEMVELKRRTGLNFDAIVAKWIERYISD